MLKQTSKEFKKLFLLQFTRELIRNSTPEEVFKLEKILKKEEKDSTKSKESKRLIKDILKEKEKELSFIKEEKPFTLDKKKPKDLKKGLESLKRIRPVLKIPEAKLPPTFDYLRPSPKNIQINLEKLNPLAQDPLVKVIECNGPEENILVRGAMGVKPTSIILNKEEIDQVIKTFSEAAKIPIHEGIFKAVVGRLILSAIISDVVGSKFIIKKMMYHPGFNPK